MVSGGAIAVWGYVFYPSLDALALYRAFGSLMGLFNVYFLS